MNGLDFVMYAILLTTAIFSIGFAVKACHILNKDWRLGHSLLEIKPVSQPVSRQLPKK